MAYTKTEWVTGAPITQEKMNKIEQGIADAHDSNSVNTNNIDSINSFINDTLTPAITTLSTDQANMKLDLTSMQWYAEMGKNAWTEVQDALIYDESEPPQIATHLNKRISDIEDIAESSAQEVIAARKGERILRDKIDDMDLRTDVLYGNIDTINRTFNEASQSPYENKLGFANTIKDRLDNSEQKLVETMNELATAHESTAFGRRKTQDIDNSFVSLDSRLEEGESRIVSLEQEVANAHESTALGKTGLNSYETLDQRFEAIEAELVGPTSMTSRLDTIEGNVSDLSNNKINITDIANNLTTATTGKVLDAYQGKILNDGKINYTDIIDNLTSTAIDRPLSANQGKVLADRIDLIDNPSTGTIHGLDIRMTAAENAISHAASGNDAGGLTERLTAAEGDINTIANELSMYNTQTSAIEATNSRVDTIEANVVAIGKEIGMIQDDAAVVDLSTAVSRTDTRVDGIENEINDAHRVLSEGTDTLDNRFDDAETRLGVLESDLNTTTTGVKARIDTIESDLNTAATGIKARLDTIDTPSTGAIAQLQSADNELDARLDAIDGGTALTGTALKDRVATVESEINTATTGIKARLTTLEGKDTIIIPKPVTGSNYYAGEPDILNPSSDADYLIQADDDKYYYWRYFDGAVGWQLVGGAGGSGNNSGFDYPNAQDYDDLQIKEENTDYYVKRSDGYHHYRWVAIEDTLTGLSTLTEIEIGTVINTDNIKKYNIARVDTTRTNVENGQTEEVSYLNLYEFDYGADNTVIDDESTSMHLRAQIELPKGGGGGGSSSTAVNKLVRIGNQAIQTIVGSTIKLQMFYSSWDDNESSDGTYTLKSGDTVLETGTFNSGAKNETIDGWQANTAGYYEFDVTDKCKIGNTSFSIIVNVNGVNLGKSWTVNVIDLHLESSAPDTLLLNSDSTYSFQYTPFGALNKTLHVLIDGEQIATQTLVAATSGRVNSFTIPAQSHGAHTIEMYLTAVIGNVEQQTDSIIREYIWYNANNTTVPVILASKYNDQTINAQQYSTIEIPYQVYKKDATSIDVYYYLDDEVTEFDKVTLDGTNIGTLSYLATDSGSHTITIKVDNVSIEVNLAISELNINVAPVSGAVIDFDPTTLTNNSTNRLPSWVDGNNTYALTVSDNFNWSDDISGGGYKQDVDGKCFVIKAGSYVDLNYPLFARKENNTKTVLDTGAEMKIIFKTKAVRDIEAVWFDNTGTLTEKKVGIQLSAHYGWLKTDKATNTTTKDTIEEYPAWNAETSYSVDDVVVSKNVIYKCIKVCVDNTVIIPGSNNASSFWEVINSTDETPEAWASGTEYAKGDIVTYNNILYKAKKDILNEPATNPKDLSDNWLKMGATESETIATNSYLYFPYSEEDKIELDININAYNANSDNNFIMSYEDGVPSKAYSYNYGSGGDGLYHNNTIRIGSPDCDVYIYHLRIYKNSLETDQILQNFIADGKNIDEKVERYNRNCIYWDDTLEQYFTSPSGTAVLDPIKLAERMPDVKVLMLDTPVFTVGKKNFVQGSSLRCIQADGGNVYTSRGDADNWLFTNGFHAGQGTTSDNYGQSARNVDFLFEVDGVHYPTKAKNMKGYTPSDEYVSAVYVGKNASEWVEVDSTNHINAWQPKAGATPNTCSDWKGDDCKISLTDTSIPNNYFNLKVNVASSENVNNALFQKRYNDFLEYTSPAQANQIAKHGAAYRALGLNTNKLKVKNGMEFVPAVLFVRENDPTQDSNGNYIKHTEFNDTKWHFYALGNIGDSKKTDYTRAYDPDDMNEFTCENSDNNTNNGQFQSGVFMYNNTRAIETPYEAYDSTETYAEGDIVVDNGVIKVYDGSDWTNATLTGWTDQTTPYFAPYTAPNPMQYLYPITSSEWNVKIGDDFVNYKHNTLVNEEFDGDHSFEFRYACRGDYRDGDLINVSEGQDDDAQFALNHDVMLAFYEWLITSTEEQYAAEAELWFVKPAMEFFYAYTHYYTMMDNRAKNTFWHFAKTNTRKAVPIGRAFPDLLHIYEESDGNGGYQAATGEFDNTKQYYTKYAFDLWVYDTDTAAGIDNNGALVFPYGKEDTDYRTEGDPQSGYAFNGAGSIFWRRLRSTFTNEITEIMNNADANCFNSEDLINQFDEFQNCFPEEIWRLDIERKYIRTFTGESVDNSVTTGKQNPRFLTSMMQGRKKYQRRQWIRDQGVYFNSKYRLTNIISNDNTIEFNCTTPAEIEDIAVTPSYYLKLTPYQDMYLNVQVGNGNYQPQIRAKAGQEYTYNLSGNYQETRIYINGANHLSGIGNLAPMYPYSFDLRALAHIKTLDIGTDVEGYTNTKFTELVLPNYMPLLESLNIKNCHSIGGIINLAQANNIRTVEATGTSITGVSLPDYTNIETLHLPSSVTAVSLYGARFLKDFKILNNAGNEDYSGLYTLNVYDSDYSANFKENDSDPLPIDWINIALEMLEKESTETYLALLNLSSATINNMETMAPIAEFKSVLEEAAQGGLIDISGTITVKGNWSQTKLDDYNTIFGQGNINWVLNQANKVAEYKLRFYKDIADIVPGSDRGAYYIKYISPEAGSLEVAIGEDPVYDNSCLAPTKQSTVSTEYIFGDNANTYYSWAGWTINNSAIVPNRTTTIQSNTDFIAVFTPKKRSYPLYWYLHEGDTTAVNDNPPLIPYGESYEEGIAPTVLDLKLKGLSTASVNTSDGINCSYSIFTGWSRRPVNLDSTFLNANQTAYCIYGNWDEGVESIASIKAQAVVDAKKLLTVSHIADDGVTLPVNSTISIDMGYDNNTGTVIIGPHATETIGPGGQVYDGTIQNGTKYGPAVSFISRNNSIEPSLRATSITPFSDMINRGFTLAVDYSIDSAYIESIYGDRGYAILCGCYDNTGETAQGFAVYYDCANKVTKVCFGNLANATTYSSSTYSCAISNSANVEGRNIVVIRHRADSNSLQVYSGVRTSILTSLTDNNLVQEITWSKNNSNKPLCFGHFTNSSFTSLSSVRAGIGTTIHWAKYWNEDLGKSECTYLASWAHENLVFAVEDYSNNGDQDIINTNSQNVILSALQLSHYGGPVFQAYDRNATGNQVSWGTGIKNNANSIYKQIANYRFFNGLPITIQAVATETISSASVIQLVYNVAGYGYVYNTSNTTIDYAFLPSLIEVGGVNANYETEANLTMPWRKASNTRVINYSGTNFDFTNSTQNATYMNVRCVGIPINHTLNTIYTGYTGTDPVYNKINTSSNTIKRGDIFVHKTTATNGTEVITTYIYADANDKTNGVPTVLANTGTALYCESGGWVKAQDWWLRSTAATFDNNGQDLSAQPNPFYYVDSNGEINYRSTPNAGLGGWFVYEFGI